MCVCDISSEETPLNPECLCSPQGDRLLRHIPPCFFLAIIATSCTSLCDSELFALVQTKLKNDQLELNFVENAHVDTWGKESPLRHQGAVMLNGF